MASISPFVLPFGRLGLFRPGRSASSICAALGERPCPPGVRIPVGALRLKPHLFCRYCRHDRYVGSTVAFGLELDFAVQESEQGVVLAATDIGAGMPFGPALPHENVSGQRHSLRRTVSHRGGDRRSRARCGMNRLLSYEP